MTFNDLTQKLENVKAEKTVIGRSVFDQPIYLYHIGSYNSPQVFLSGGMHAREYITSLFLLKEIDYLLEKDFNGYVLPLVNPDGVGIVLDGIEFIPTDYKNLWSKICKNGNPKLIKCNGRGVDLNVNYDAKWGTGIKNQRGIGTENYIGPYSFSEPENIAIKNFIDSEKPEISLAFHSKGEVIYYGFEKYNEDLLKDSLIAKELSKQNGYQVIKTKNSAGGLSDYINYKLKKSAFTIEVGSDKLRHPIDEKHLGSIFKKNKNLPIVVNKFLKN